MNEDDLPTLDSTPEGLDALADDLLAEYAREGLHVDRDRLRAQLTQLEGVVFDPVRGVAVRRIEHEEVGDWRRVTFQPFLRLIPGGKTQ